MDIFNNEIIIRRYKNRKLYNMSTSRYIKLDELAAMIYEGKTISIHDDNGADITEKIFKSILLTLDIDLPKLITIIRDHYNKGKLND